MGLPPVDVQTMFYALEVLPGVEYKLTVGRDAEVEFTQACLTPSCRAGQSAALRIQQLENDDSEDEDEEEPSPAFVIARLSVGGTETKALKACQVSDGAIVISVVGAAQVHLTGQLVVDVNSEASGVQVEEIVPEGAQAAKWTPTKEDPGVKRNSKGEIEATYSQREVTKPTAGWTPEKEDPGLKRTASGDIDEVYTPREPKKQKKEQAEKAEKKAKAEKKPEAEKDPEKPRAFVSSRKFTGARKGYIFKKGKMGVGYYLDEKPVVDRAKLAAFLKGGKQAQKNQKQQEAAAASARGKVDAVWRSGPQGMKFKTMKAGSGPRPKRGTQVRCKYMLRLRNEKGPVIDKSGARPFSFTLGLGEVIKGWDIGIADMNKGEKRAMLVPPAIGYGKRGSPPDIPKNSTLYFEVELV